MPPKAPPIRVPAPPGSVSPSAPRPRPGRRRRSRHEPDLALPLAGARSAVGLRALRDEVRGAAAGGRSRQDRPPDRPRPRPDPRAERRVELPHPARPAGPAGRQVPQPAAAHRRAARRLRHAPAQGRRPGRGRERPRRADLRGAEGDADRRHAAGRPARTRNQGEGRGMRSEAPLDRDENPCRPRHFKPTLTPPCAADAPVSRSLDLAHKRLVTIGTAFALAFIVIGLRLADVTLLREPDAQVLRLEQPAVVQPVHYGRADILDRNGNVIATTLASPSLFANPHLIVDKPATARQLAKLLPGTNVAEIEAKLATDKSFVWLARHLTPGQEYAITALGIPGLDFEHEERRVYPAGVLAAHVAGYTDLDNKGLAGIERSFDTTLDSSREPLRLSIDLRLQAILKEEMQKQIDDYNGIGASGVVMDVRTGEILSLVSLPDFDPNQMREMAAKRGPSKDADDPRFNRATLGIYEMGSVFKIFNTALGLDDKKLTLASSFPTDPIHYGRFTIHDFAGEHIPNPANVTTIFMESSNIGSARMVQLSGPELQREFLGRLGLLRPAPIELPEVGGPEVPSPWREINAMTISYGHGLGVSQVQTAIAAAAVVNGGILHPASLIKHADGYVPAGERVLSEETSAEMRKL